MFSRSNLLISKNIIRFTCLHSSSISSVKHNDYVLNLVKKFDYENYLASLLIKDNVVRRSVLAFRALNVELAQVLDVTKQPMAVQGRFLFWTQVVDELFSGSTKNISTNPIIGELHKALEDANGSLSKRHFKKLIAGRSKPEHLTSFPFETVQQLQDYFESSIGPVYYLLIEAYIVRDPTAKNIHLKLDHVASHLANSQGISNVLRGVAHNARSGRCYIPSDLLSKHQASHQDFLKYRSKKEVFDISYDLASIANNHLKIAKNLLEDSQVKPFESLFMPIILVDMYLKKLEKNNFDIFSKDLYQKDGMLPLKLWMKSLKRKW